MDSLRWILFDVMPRLGKHVKSITYSVSSLPFPRPEHTLTQQDAEACHGAAALRLIEDVQQSAAEELPTWVLRDRVRFNLLQAIVAAAENLKAVELDQTELDKPGGELLLDVLPLKKLTRVEFSALQGRVTARFPSLAPPNCALCHRALDAPRWQAPQAGEAHDQERPLRATLPRPVFLQPTAPALP